MLGRPSLTRGCLALTRTGAALFLAEMAGTRIIAADWPFVGDPDVRQRQSLCGADSERHNTTHAEWLLFRRRSRNDRAVCFTPAMIPSRFAMIVPLEAGMSGSGVNPAHSFGPAIISGVWQGWWIYWIGPLFGGLVAILVCNSFAKRIEVAKLYYFDSAPQELIRRVQRPQVGSPPM